MSDLTWGVAKVLREPVNVFAPWTLARGLIESVGLLTWLLAPDLRPRERIGRSLTLRLHDFRERRMWVECGDIGADQVEELLARSENQLSAIAVELGIELKISRDGKLLGYGCSKPGPTERARDLGWEEAYRLESGIAHGFHWATSAAGLRQRDEANMQVAIEPTLLVSVLSSAIVRHLRGTDSLFRYMGWDLEALAPSLDPLLDSVGLEDRLRPWRSM